MKAFLCYFIAFLVFPLHAREKSTLHILALVPMVQGNETTLPVENWRRGWEMIPGANLAVDMINNDSMILQDTLLKLITINSSADGSFQSLVDFVRVSTDRDNNIVAIIGTFFDKEIEIFSPLAAKFNISFQISTSMSPQVFNKVRFPHQIHMVQSASVLIRALFSLVEFYNWTGLSVITSGSDPLYLRIAEEIHTTSKQYSGTMIKEHIHNSVSNFNVDRVKSNIIITSMNIRDTVYLICTGQLKDLAWPKYAWIVLSHSVNDFISNATTLENSTNCIASRITEGVIFIQQDLTVKDHHLNLISGLTYNNLSQLLRHCSLAPKVNPYAYVLHDAIWTVALALNESNDTDISATLNDIDFTGASGPVKFVNNERKGLSVEILQVRGKRTKTLGIFVNDNLTIINHIGDIDQINNAQAQLPQGIVFYEIILHSSVILCTIFTTLTFTLYLHFRQKAAIKATSTVLSVMIFLSCYLLLFYLSILSADFSLYFKRLPHYFGDFICTVYPWFNGLAIPVNLGLSVVIVKIIRVYRIFSEVIRTSRKCKSNSMLLLQIFLIMVPNLLILILWSAIDPYKYQHYSITTASGKTISREGCFSDHLVVWSILLLLNLVLLMVSLVVVAVKTRKIRYKNFKDTKKVNALIFMLILTISFTISYYLILLALQDDNAVLRHVILHIGHVLIIYELMGFLFVPKIFPLIREKWFTTKCISTHNH